MLTTLGCKGQTQTTLQHYIDKVAQFAAYTGHAKALPIDGDEHLRLPQFCYLRLSILHNRQAEDRITHRILNNRNPFTLPQL